MYNIHLSYQTETVTVLLFPSYEMNSGNNPALVYPFLSLSILHVYVGLFPQIEDFHTQ